MKRFEGNVVGPPRWTAPLGRMVWNRKISPFAASRFFGQWAARKGLKKYCRATDALDSEEDK